MALTLNGEAIRDTFQAWHTERDSLDAQLNESLTALSAYQSHLDTWQHHLARERDELHVTREQVDRDRDELRATGEQIEHARDELRTMREQFERDRTATDKNHASESATTVKELHDARDKITALTTLLLNRTEELRTLDNRRAEVQTELELSRAREKELKVALDEHKRSVEQERSQYAEELKQLREVLERQLESPVIEEQVPAVEQPAPGAHAQPAPVVRSQPTGGTARVIPRENPVLGSIVEQFGKLRQQRATERQASNRPR